MEKIKIREDLNEMVKSIGFKHNVTKFGTRDVVNVKLFNDVVIEFKDTDGLYDLFNSFVQTNQADFIKSKELVEEYRNDDEGQVIGTYICVKYELTNGKTYRLFPSKFTSYDVIGNYYNQYKKENKANTPKK